MRHGSWLCCLVSALVGTFASGCAPDGAGAVVQVQDLPQSAARLRILSRIDGTPANETPELDVRPSAGQPSYSFALQLPGGARGRSLLIALEVLDEYGCLVAVGSSSSDVRAYDSVSLDKRVIQLSPITPQECRTERPLLFRVTPAGVTTTGTDLNGRPVRMSVHGWGLWPGTRLQLDGNELTEVRWESASEVSAPAPARLGRLGPASVSVLVPDAQPLLGSLSYSAYGHLQFARAEREMPGLHSPRVVDITKDGFSDLVALSSRGGVNTLSVFVNDGHGNFPEQPITTPLDPKVLEFAIADLDGDATLDLVAVGHAPDLAAGIHRNYLYTYPGNGTGRFGSGSVVELPITNAVGIVVSADLNKDRLDDLVITTANRAQLPSSESFRHILMNQGQARFTITDSVESLSLPFYTCNGRERMPPAIKSLAFLDYNNDGNLELQSVHFWPGITTIENGFFRSGHPVYFVDDNRDGVADLVTSDDKKVYLSKGGAIPSYGMELGLYETALQGVDLNGDGLRDYWIKDDELAINTQEPLTAMTARFHLEGYTPPLTCATDMLTCDISRILFDDDLDYDGRRDIVVIDACKSSLNIYINKSE